MHYQIAFCKWLKRASEQLQLSRLVHHRVAHEMTTLQAAQRKDGPSLNCVSAINNWIAENPQLEAEILSNYSA